METRGGNPYGKALWLFLVLLLVWQSTAFAERYSRRGGTRGGLKTVEYPVYLGFSFPSNVSNGGQGSIDGSNGIAFGVGLAVKVLPQWYLGIDALYVSKNYILSNGATTEKYRVAFVEIPLQIKYSPTPNFMLHLGPYLAGLVVSATRESGGTEVSVKSNVDNDFGITMGVWIGVRLKNAVSAGLNARYDLGLADIQKDFRPEDSVKTRSLIVMVTFSFGF